MSTIEQERDTTTDSHIPWKPNTNPDPHPVDKFLLKNGSRLQSLKAILEKNKGNKNEDSEDTAG